MDKLQEIFGIEEANAIRKALPNAKIVEIYDNAVDVEIPTEYGRYVFGIYCYYEKGDNSHPVAGAIDYDTDNLHCEFPDNTFSKEEKGYLQEVLDAYKFEKGHFGEAIIAG